MTSAPVNPVSDPIPRTISWRAGKVRVLDQRALPARVRYVDCATAAQLCDAISSLAIRGAPALGAAGAYGVALAAHTMRTARQVRVAAERVAATRPTAVNLRRGVDEALAAYEREGAAGALATAERIADEDIARNRRIGSHGSSIVPRDAQVLTHCNAGALACVGYGTALGVVRGAVESGKRVARVGRRDASRAAGRAPHRVGARPPGHRRDPRRRQRSRVVDGGRSSRSRRRGRRSHRRER